MKLNFLLIYSHICVYVCDKYLHRNKIELSKFFYKVIRYNINSPFRDKNMICYQYKVGELNFYKFINNNLVYLVKLNNIILTIIK